MNDAEAAHERRAMMLTIIIIFLVLTWIIVLLRTWVRGFIIRSFGWDDAITLLATVCVFLCLNFLIKWTYRIPGNVHTLRWLQHTTRALGFRKPTLVPGWAYLHIKSCYGTDVSQSVL